MRPEKSFKDRKYLVKIYKEEPANPWSQKHRSSMTTYPSKTNDNNIRRSHFLLGIEAKELNISKNIRKGRYMELHSIIHLTEKLHTDSNIYVLYCP